jgi:hypothetical protein
VTPGSTGAHDAEPPAPVEALDVGPLVDALVELPPPLPDAPGFVPWELEHATTTPVERSNASGERSDRIGTPPCA